MNNPLKGFAPNFEPPDDQLTYWFAGLPNCTTGIEEIMTTELAPLDEVIAKVKAGIARAKSAGPVAWQYRIQSPGGVWTKWLAYDPDHTLPFPPMAIEKRPLYAQSAPAVGWVSVSECKPTGDVDVLVTDVESTLKSSIWTVHASRVNTTSHTHWQPLPAAPTEAE